MDFNNDWSKVGYFYTKELRRIDIKTHDLDLELDKMQIEVAKLKVKSGIWGLVGGVIPIAIYFFVEIMKEQV